MSFPTIAGVRPNSAIVHYSVTRSSNRVIAARDLLLVDSGGQYEDGTTDARTIAIGTPSQEMRDRFTRVLRGHIAIARAIFPDGTTVPSSTVWHANICGRPVLTMTTAPVTGWAAISRSMRARRGSPGSAPRRSNAA